MVLSVIWKGLEYPMIPMNHVGIQDAGGTTHVFLTPLVPDSPQPSPPLQLLLDLAPVVVGVVLQVVAEVAAAEVAGKKPSEWFTAYADFIRQPACRSHQF